MPLCKVIYVLPSAAWYKSVVLVPKVYWQGELAFSLLSYKKAFFVYLLKHAEGESPFILNLVKLVLEGERFFLKLFNCGFCEICELLLQKTIGYTLI